MVKRPTVKFSENWRTGHMFFSRKLSWLYQVSSTHRKMWDRPHFLQQETQLAVSNFFNSQKTGGQATCSSAGNSAGCIKFPLLTENCGTGHMFLNSAGCIKFPLLTENCGTGHMFFSRKLSWLYQISSTHRKLWDRPHVLQQETQLAVSHVLMYHKF